MAGGKTRGFLGTSPNIVQREFGCTFCGTDRRVPLQPCCQGAFISGVVMSQSGRHFLATARKSWRSSSMVGLGGKPPRLGTRTAGSCPCTSLYRVLGHWRSVPSLRRLGSVTSLIRRGIVRYRSSCDRKPRPPFRADRFQSSGAHRSVRRTGVCPRNQLEFPRPSLEWFGFH
jgi:hypothetical protein